VKFYAEGKEEKAALYHQLKTKKKKVLIIINGKSQPESFELNSIDPDDIEAINVQTGKDIIREYGKAAKDGVIFISTEKSVKAGAGTSNKLPSDIHIVDNAKFSRSDDKAKIITTETEPNNASELEPESCPAKVIFYPEAEKTLVVLDGKEMKIDFDMKSIAPENIESVNVLKGENATEEYGDKGKNGVIIITTKKTGSKKGG
jgi:TonB-dependent SusC/RagA subfamily outer membrane receptor